MGKRKDHPYTPWFQSDYERAATPAELVIDFGRRHFARAWQGIPSVERTPGGALFAVWYSGGITEGMDNFVLLARKRNGGEWEKPLLVVECVPGVRAFDPNIWLDPAGRLHLFWAQALMYFDGREGVWEAICDEPDADEPVFGAPRRLSDGLMLNKPTVLPDGRWLYTVARCRMKPFHAQHLFTVLGDDPDEDRRNAQVYASADGGNTVSFLGEARCDNSDFYEHMVYARADGSLRMLIRSRPTLMESVSLDGGRSWSKAAPSDIANPQSRFFVRRMPSGRLVLLNHETSAARDRLCAFLSDDDGNTWPYKLMLDERSGVSYPDATIDEAGRLYIIYDRDRYGALEILMASVTEAEILEGRISSAESFLRRVIDRG